MLHDLNEYPEELNPGRAPAHKTLAGDHGDDDGQYISDLLTSPQYDAPPPEVSPRAERPKLPKPKSATRLLTGRIRLVNGMTPIVLLNADVNRQHILVQVSADGQSAMTREGGIPGERTALLAAATAGSLITSIPAIAGYRVYVTGFTITWNGAATADANLQVDFGNFGLAGVGQTPYDFGVEIGLPGSLSVTFPNPIPASDATASTNINVTVAAATGPEFRLITHYYYLPATNPDNGVRLADSSGTIASAPFITEWKNDFHTGEVWIYPENLAEPVWVDFWAVTA